MVNTIRIWSILLFVVTQWQHLKNQCEGGKRKQVSMSRPVCFRGAREGLRVFFAAAGICLRRIVMKFDMFIQLQSYVMWHPCTFRDIWVFIIRGQHVGTTRGTCTLASYSDYHEKHLLAALKFHIVCNSSLHFPALLSMWFFCVLFLLLCHDFNLYRLAYNIKLSYESYQAWQRPCLLKIPYKKKTIHDLENVLLIIKICQKVSFQRKNLANKNTTPLLQDG